MRGKVGGEGEGKDRVRITPAYAGKSSSVADTQHRRQDHPRLCGEKTFASGVVASFAGSPPPMRGKAIDSVKPSASWGITPAYAGKSLRTA